MANKAKKPPFGAIHRHGFVRVAAASPVASAGDVGFNVEETLKLARQADARGVDLAVFPELNISSYAIDDLHLQDAFLDAVEAGIARLAKESAELKTVLLVGAPLRRNGRLYNCGLAIARGQILGVVPKCFLPNYREYYEKRWFASGVGLEGLKIEVAGQGAPFGPDLVFAADDLADFVFHIEICEDFWAPQPPSTAGRARRRADPHQPLGLQHHHRQGGRAQIALRQPVQPLHRRLCLFRRRAGREHHRSRLGRPGFDLRAWRTARRDRPVRLGIGACRRRYRRPAPAAGADAQRHVQRQCPRRRPSRKGVPQHRLRARARDRRHRLRAEAAPLPLRPQPARAARSGLLRGVQHPGPGPRPPLPGDRRRPSRHRRLGRARFDPRADRRRQGLRRTRSCRARPSLASPCPASPPARRPRAMPGR